jgi:hypothetical protein
VSISDIIAKAKGRAGAWRVERGEQDGVTVASLWHYSTRMMAWRLDEPSDEEYLYLGTGWGSVSDQNGCNTAARMLGLPYYYSRKGGADWLSLDDVEDCRRLPRYLWNRGVTRGVGYTADAAVLTAEAEALGKQAGESAASWIVDGNTSTETAREIVRMIEEGDPAFEAPAPLSGEWSGGLVATDVLASAGCGLTEDDEAAGDVLDAFERGYCDGWYAEAERRTRAVLQ